MPFEDFIFPTWRSTFTSSKWVSNSFGLSWELQVNSANHQVTKAVQQCNASDVLQKHLSKTIKEHTHIQSSLLTRWEHGLGCGYTTGNGFRGDSITLQLFFFPPHSLLKLNVAQQNGTPEEILQFLGKECSFELLLWLSKECSLGTLYFLWLVILPPPKSDKKDSPKLNMRREIRRWRNTERSYHKTEGKE